MIRWEKIITILILVSFSFFFLGDNIASGKSEVLHYGEMVCDIQIKEEQRSDIKREEDDKEYVIWKEKYNKTHKQIKKSKILGYIGMAGMLGGLGVAYLSRTTEKKGGGSIWLGDPSYRYGVVVDMPTIEEEEYDTGLLIGAFVLVGLGGTLAIISAINHKKANYRKKALEEEGRVKGYLDLKLNPKTKSVAVSYIIEF